MWFCSVNCVCQFFWRVFAWLRRKSLTIQTNCLVRKPIVENIAVGATVTDTLKSIVELSDDAVDAWYGSSIIREILWVATDSSNSGSFAERSDVLFIHHPHNHDAGLGAVGTDAAKQHEHHTICSYTALHLSFICLTFCLSLHLSDFLCEDVKKRLGLRMS